jgi:hypothetical protein
MEHPCGINFKKSFKNISTFSIAQTATTGRQESKIILKSNKLINLQKAIDVKWSAKGKKNYFLFF